MSIHIDSKKKLSNLKESGSIDDEFMKYIRQIVERVLRKFRVDSSSREDLRQDALLAIIKLFDKDVTVSCADAFFYRVARNQIVDSLRRINRYEKSHYFEDDSGKSVIDSNIEYYENYCDYSMRNPEQFLIDQDLVNSPFIKLSPNERGKVIGLLSGLQAEKLVHQVLSKLSNEEFYLVDSLIFNNLKQGEVAKELGISQSTVSRRLEGALNSVRWHICLSTLNEGQGYLVRFLAHYEFIESGIDWFIVEQIQDLYIKLKPCQIELMKVMHCSNYKSKAAARELDFSIQKFNKKLHFILNLIKRYMKSH